MLILGVGFFSNTHLTRYMFILMQGNGEHNKS